MSSRPRFQKPPRWIRFRSDPVADLLGTGMRPFVSDCGIHGLGAVREGCLHLLAVNATKPQTGQFRAFINLAKQHFKKIVVVQIWNGSLKSKLADYQFQPKVVEWEGETLDAMVFE